VKIVLDTNVLASGLLSPFGPPAEILRMIAVGDLLVCHDARILAEYRAVLARRRFRFDGRLVATLVDHVEAAGVSVASRPTQLSLSDEGARPFAEVAVAGAAQFLVTGNVKHLPARRYGTARVITPRELLRRLSSNK
jgi:uncharacterized protein